MAQTRIVLVGAGSVSFGLEILADLLLAKDRLAGSTVVLVDIDGERVEKVASWARLACAAYGADLRIESTTDRRAALRGARFIVVAVARRREEMWKLDFEVPIRHGVRHVLGENGGPGALFHSARSISLVLPIARDVEELCPEALLLNFTNPMGRVCRAIARYTNVKVVGLCHQIGHMFMSAGKVLGRWPREPASWDEHRQFLREMEKLFDVKAAGLNHFTWLLDLRSRENGSDLYPAFRTALAGMPAEFEPLSRYLMDAYGLMPTGGDGHVGEYVSFAHEFMSMKGYDFDGAVRERREMWERIDRVIARTEALPPELSASGERAVEIVCSSANGVDSVIPALNLPNRGSISNLPADAIVEVPGIASGWGVRGLEVGRLPEGIAGLCRRQLDVQELAVEAAATGSRTIALQALLADPLVPGARAAGAILDELLRREAGELPQFA